MSQLMKSLPAPGWLRDLVDATAAYQELLGWPVSVRVGQRNLVVAVGRVLRHFQPVTRVRCGCMAPAPNWSFPRPWR
jgi:hypothetical protein